MKTPITQEKSGIADLGGQVSVGQLERLIDRGQPLQLVDVRTPQEYSLAHIPGAINIPMEELAIRLEDIRTDSPAVLICHSGRRAELCRSTMAKQVANPTVLVGGTKAWQDAGHRVVGRQKATIPLMRQVQLVAGVLILAGAGLSATVSHYWIGLSAFVGAGLTLAGATGYCGMANLLALMPWNRTAAR